MGTYEQQSHSWLVGFATSPLLLFQCHNPQMLLTSLARRPWAFQFILVLAVCGLLFVCCQLLCPPLVVIPVTWWRARRRVPELPQAAGEPKRMNAGNEQHKIKVCALESVSLQFWRMQQLKKKKKRQLFYYNVYVL